MIKITKNWANLLKEEFQKPYFKELQAFLDKEYSTHTIYPAMENIFNALNAVKYEDVKVVIIGQDPYHEPGQAQGMAFSVPDGIEIPPSLVNIYKEIENDLGIKCEKSGNLMRWAKQGVLLLNTSLTVRRGQANSHRGHGWEIFTNEIIKFLSNRPDPMVFMLWGSNAQSFAPEITFEKTPKFLGKVYDKVIVFSLTFVASQTTIHKTKKHQKIGVFLNWSGRRDSNSRHLPWQGNALPLSHSRKTLFSNALIIYQII